MTALVHGEGAHDERAALLRHVLACPVCRPEHAANERMLLALHGLGAARASGAPRAPRVAPPRERFAFAAPAVAAAIVLATVFAAFHRTDPAPTPSREPVPVAQATLEPASRDLLSSQRPDGRWTAEPGLGGAGGDEAATGLVVLALLRPGREALTDAGVLRAVSAGSRWLGDRASALAEGASPADVRTRAVVSAALLRALDLTGDTALRPAARSLLLAVADDAEASAGDPTSRRWIDYALAQAEQAGWPGAGRDRRRLEASPTTDSPGASRGAAPTELAAAAASPGTPVRLALTALRDEPPLRRLAWSRAP
jgi:hypothetical protein